MNFCQVAPEQLALADQLTAKWPDSRLSWTLMDEVTGISYEDLKAAADIGLNGWRTCSGLEPVFTNSARDARLLIYAARLDGPGRVLADCELPMGQSQVKMRLDISEDWVAKIKLPVVIRHEGGHGAGLGHAPGGSINWMAPQYNPSVLAAGAWDTQEMIGRYGRVRPISPTGPSLPPSGGFGMSGLLQLLVKLAPIIQWLIQNKDSMSGLLELLKKIADAFNSTPKPALLAAMPLELVDKAAFKAFLESQVAALKALAQLTHWDWDDQAAKFLDEAVKTEWLFNLIYDILSGNVVVTEKMLEQAAKV
jgi:hypothetical protein